MAINKNHEFDDLQGVKCAIVEKNVPLERVDFLRDLLELNRYTVMVVPSPQQATFTVGVTDVTFSAVTAVYGRQLHTGDGRVVTLAYWRQKDC